MFNLCAIVTDLYHSHWEHGDKGFAPKTLTELYTGFVHNIIMLLRHLAHHHTKMGTAGLMIWVIYQMMLVNSSKQLLK